MPAVTSLTIYGTARAMRALTLIGGRLARRVKQIARLVRNRRDAGKLWPPLPRDATRIAHPTGVHASNMAATY